MISIIIPFYNEEDSLPVLINQLIKTADKLKIEYEIILVDDGSTDKSLTNFKFQISNFKLIKHRRRFGKGKALETGFKASSGEIIVFMDADLQDDPSDLKQLLNKINEGYDLVNGWRSNRKDPLAKTIPSAIFNFFLLKVFFRSKFHDINCGYKAMKRGILEEIPLYGDNYRFLPLMAENSGFKTGEVVVTHHSRKYGQSKFGLFRLLSGLLDTLTTYFIFKFSEKPLQFFGPIGSFLFLIGFLINLYLAIERIFYQALLYRRPILFLGMLLVIVGIQFVMTGIIGELIVYLDKKKNL